MYAFFDLVIPLLEFILGEYLHMCKDICIKVFLTALISIVKNIRKGGVQGASIAIL